MAKEKKQKEQTVSTVRQAKHGWIWTIFFSILSILWLSPIILVLMNSFKRKAYIFRNPFGISAFKLSDGFDKWSSGIEKAFFGIQNYVNGLKLTEFPKVTSPNVLQLINMEVMSVTLLKTMLLRSRLVRLLHPLNIRERSSAFSVLKLLRFRSARFSQSANIHLKSVAFLGLKPLRSSSVNASQSKNI